MPRSIRAVAVLVALAAVTAAAVVSRAADPPPAPPRDMIPAPAPMDSFAAERDSLMKVVLASIAGRENAPAESVFKKIEIMKGMPAGRLVRIMNMGYGRSLGVGCKHCHDIGDYAAEGKTPKAIARDMSLMTRTINEEMLPKMEDLKSERPMVNCTTCHRGQVKPATNL